MDKFDEELGKVFKKDIHLSNQYNQTIRRTLNRLPNLKMRRKLINPVFRSLATGIACLIFSTGIIFAKDISEKIYNFYETGKGIETAINDGYIAENNSEYTNFEAEFVNEDTGIIIESSSVKVKVQDIVMDDFNLSATIVVNLSDEVQKQIKKEDIWEMRFPDLIVSDEEGNVLFGMDPEALKKYFNEDDINKIYDNEKMCNSGLNNFIADRGTMPVKAVYNMYVESPDHYPKSKKLKFEFTKIAVSNSDDTMYGDEEITIKGDWKVEADLPSKFYNRKTYIYNQVGGESSEDKILSCAVYNTNTIIELALKSKKQPQYSVDYYIYNLLDAPSDIEDYIMNNIRRTDEYRAYEDQRRSYYQKENVYITNSKGERFELTQGPIPNGGGSIDENGIYKTTCMLDLTQKDATNELTMHLTYLGKDLEFKLEKNEEE